MKIKKFLKEMSDLVFEKALSNSKTVNEITDTVSTAIKQVNQLALSVVELAKTLQNHHDAINDLYAYQDQLTEKIKGQVDSKIEINRKEKSPNKPNLIL